MTQLARKTVNFMTAMQAVLVAGIFFGLAAMLLWTAYSAGYSNGRLEGLQEGWEDCSHPMRDMRNGETRCPGSDLPGVALDLR